MINYLRKYFNGLPFIIVTYLLTIFCWCFHLQLIAMGYYIIMGIAIIILDAKRINLITLIMAGIINYRDTTYQANIWLFIGGGVIILPILTYDLFKKKPHFKNDIFIAMLVFLGANIISLVNTNKDTYILGLVGIAQVFVFCIIFFYFYNKHNSEDYRYIAKNATILGLAISIELVIYFFRYEGEVIGKDIVLGWGISNSIAMTYMLIIPLTYYLYLENQRKYILLFLVIDIMMVLLTLCKGAYITIAILIIPAFILSLKTVYNKKKFYYDLLYSVIILIVLFVAISFIDSIREGYLDYFHQMSNRGWFNDNSRKLIYETALNVFKDYPLFGAGSYTSSYYLVLYGLEERLKHYHNFIIQTLATLGITGLIAFGYYLWQVFKKCLIKKAYNLCVLFAIIAMIIHGLVDNTWYNPITMILITIYLSAIFPKETKNLVLN